MEIKNYLSFIILAGLLFLAFFILKNFVSSILTAFVLAYLLLYFQKKLEKRMNPKLAALLILGGLIFLILAFLFLIANSIINQAIAFFSETNLNSIFRLSDYIPDFLHPYIPLLKERIISFLSDSAVLLIKNIPAFFGGLLVTLFITYFLLIDWEKIILQIKKIIPIKGNEFYNRTEEVTKNIVLGYLLVAIIEFIISSIGFAIAGIDFFFIFALLIAIAAFIPLIGPIAVWLPIFIIQIISGNIFSAVIVLITGLILTIGVDYLFVNFIVSKRTKIHPVLVLLGVLGGVAFFGLIGFVIGPLILTLTIEYIKANYYKD